MGFRYSRNERARPVRWRGECAWACGDALLDTDPATAFDPFLNFHRSQHRSGQSKESMSPCSNSGEYELPIGYATFNGDLFNLPAGPVSFAIGGEYDAPRFTHRRDALNNTFKSLDRPMGKASE